MARFHRSDKPWLHVWKRQADVPPSVMTASTSWWDVLLDPSSSITLRPYLVPRSSLHTGQDASTCVRDHLVLWLQRRWDSNALWEGNPLVNSITIPWDPGIPNPILHRPFILPAPLEDETY